jgi:hypothetical protein
VYGFVFLTAVAFVEFAVLLLYPSPSSSWRARWCSSWEWRCRTHYFLLVGVFYWCGCGGAVHAEFSILAWALWLRHLSGC